MFDTHPNFTLPAFPAGLSTAIVGTIQRRDPAPLRAFLDEYAPSAVPVFRRVAAEFIASRKATPDALLILADAMREWMREAQLAAAATSEAEDYDRTLAGTFHLPLVIEALEIAASALAHAR